MTFVVINAALAEDVVLKIRIELSHINLQIIKFMELINGLLLLYYLISWVRVMILD